MLDVREPDLVQGAGAAAAVLEVDLLERFGRDLLEPVVGRTLLLGVEEAGGVDRGQGHGEVADAVLVGGADRGGVAQAGTGVDDDATRPARSGRGFLIWSFTYRSAVRWETRSICATGLVPPSCFTMYRICAPALFGAGRVNAFCTASSRPSPIRLIVFFYSPLSAVLTVPSLMDRARLSSGASRTSSGEGPWAA